MLILEEGNKFSYKPIKHLWLAEDIILASYINVSKKFKFKKGVNTDHWYRIREQYSDMK